MLINYIILAHKNPNQIIRLIKRLDYMNVSFYIHIDKSVDIIPYKNKLSLFNNVFFVEENRRIKCIWGDVSIVKAIFECMRLVKNINEDGYTVLLSGQDYPLKSGKYIYDFLSRQSSNFMTYLPFPILDWGERGGYDKLDRYWFTLTNNGKKKAEIYPLSFSRKNIVNYIRIMIYSPSLLPKAISLFFKRREIPNYMEFYGGEAWWILRNSSICYILKFLSLHPDCMLSHEYSLTPDEELYHSILCSNKSIRENTRNTTLKYINWKEGNQSPDIFNMDDFPLLKAKIDNMEDYLFARKFDIEKCSSILDKIDDYVDTMSIM